MLAGGDGHANPVEYALAALASCQAITYRFWAAKLGIELDGLEVAAEGDLDLHGFFGLDAGVRPGLHRHPARRHAARAGVAGALPRAGRRRRRALPGARPVREPDRGRAPARGAAHDAPEAPMSALAAGAVSVASLRRIHLGMIDAVLAGGGVEPVAALAAEQLGGTVAIVLPAVDVAVGLAAGTRPTSPTACSAAGQGPAGVVAEVPVRSGDELLGLRRAARRRAGAGRARDPRARRGRGAHRGDPARRERHPAPCARGAVRRHRARGRRATSLARARRLGADLAAARARSRAPAPASRARAGRDRAGVPGRAGGGARRPRRGAASAGGDPERRAPRRRGGCGTRGPSPVRRPSLLAALRFAELALELGRRARRAARRRWLLGASDRARAAGAGGLDRRARRRTCWTRCAPT